VLYVAPDGLDTGPGSATQPFRTLSAATAAAAPGTVVQVADGVYRGMIVTNANGRPEARITYVAQNPGRAIIFGQDRQEWAWRNNGDNVDIIGFEVTGSSQNGILQTGSNTRIAGNDVHGFPGSCLVTYSENYALRDVDIIGNRAHGCGSSDLDHGIYVGHSGGAVLNNIVYGNSGYGIHCWHNCNNLTISNNLAFGNTTGGVVVGQGDSPNYGRVAADNFVIANNIVMDNDGPGIVESGATGSANVYLHNNVFSNAVADMQLQTGTESATVTTDPQFVDFQMDGTGDYRLRDGSPDIDTGTDRGGAPMAIDGVPRPQGAAFDIGPYER
jgi:hypothetical protein